MNPNLIKISWVLWLLLLKQASTQTTTTSTGTTTNSEITSVVFPQLNGILNFNQYTPAIQIQTDAGNFRTTKQFTLWGWYRQYNFYTFNLPSNIITLQNVQNLNSQEVEIQPYPNPNFPNCPVELSELEAKPELKEVPNIKNNPNCFPLEITNDNIQNVISDSFSITNDEILFLNYMLTNYDQNDVNQSTYELQFYLKNKDFLGDGSKSMKMYSIKNLPFVRNLWTFWAVAANYETGELILYMRVFGPNGYERLQEETLSYPNFSLNQGSLLLIGATNSNNYFKTLTGYIGEVAYIQMSPFFLKNVEYLWISEMLVEETLYDGVNAEILFDMYEKNGVLNSYGFNKNKLEIQGNYTPVYTEDKNLLGAKFSSGSSFTFSDFKYRGSPFVSSHPFNFNFSYKEALPAEYVLLEKGFPGQTGHLSFKLVQTDSGKRKLVINARSANKDFKWESSPIFEENVSYQVLAGIVVSANQTVHALMKVGNSDLILSPGMVDFENYDFSYKNIKGLNNSGSYSGYILLNRLSIMDNFSGSVLMELENSNKRIQSLSKNCLTRTDYFNGSFGCLTCKKGFVNIVKTRTCEQLCPQGFRNNGVNVCVKCLYPDCSDIPPLTWRVEFLNQQNNTYRLIPSRPIYPANIDFNQLLSLNILNMEETKDYTYTLIPGVNNEHVDVKFDFKNNINNNQVDVKFDTSKGDKLYDQNGNLLVGSNFDFKLKNTCVLSDTKRKTIENLAIAAFFITLISILFALFMLCACTKKLQGEDQLERRTLAPKNELSNAIWKFILHNWMWLQVVAFLYLLNSQFPCCLRFFFRSLYKYAVGWAHGMGPVWDSANRGNQAYQNEMSNTLMPSYFSRLQDEKGVGVTPYILHNMGVIFIFHLVVLAVYVVFRIVDCMLGTNENMFYKCFIVVHMNLVILGYLLFHMMAFVFSFLNLAFASFSTPYFVICFIISILYIAGKLLYSPNPSVSDFLHVPFGQVLFFPRKVSSTPRGKQLLHFVRRLQRETKVGQGLRILLYFRALLNWYDHRTAL
jgi:hypothetical protein